MTDIYRVVITPTIPDDRGIVFNTLDSMFSGWDLGNIWFYVQSQQKRPDNPVSEWLSQHKCNRGATYDSLATVILQIQTDILVFDSLVAFDPGDSAAIESIVNNANGKASVLRISLQRNKMASNEPVKTKPLTIPVDVSNFDLDEPSWYNEKQKIQDSWQSMLRGSANTASANTFSPYIGVGGAGGSGVISTPSATVSVSPSVDPEAEARAQAIMEYAQHMDEVKAEYDDRMSKLLMDSVNAAMAESEVPIAPPPGTNLKKPWWKF